MVDLKYVFTHLRQENDFSASADDTGNVSTSWMNLYRSGKALAIGCSSCRTSSGVVTTVSDFFNITMVVFLIIH